MLSDGAIKRLEDCCKGVLYSFDTVYPYKKTPNKKDIRALLDLVKEARAHIGDSGAEWDKVADWLQEYERMKG